MNPFMTGKTVFGNGSYAPTRGTNNPAGYIKRDINKSGPFGGVSRFGSTGRSETRSGLAKAALARQETNDPQSVPLRQPSDFIKRKPAVNTDANLQSQAMQQQKPRRRMIVTRLGALKLGDE